jgi:hypothetical protein
MDKYINAELSVEEFLSLPEQDRLAHLEWKYPPGTKCINNCGETFFVSKNPVKNYHGSKQEYGRVDDLSYLFYGSDFIEKIPQEKVLVKKSTPTKKDLSSIKTKEEAYDYLISIGVKPGMKYINHHDKNYLEIPANFLNKKEILERGLSSLDLGPGKGYFLWEGRRGFLTDFDDIDMYGNPKTQKVNGGIPVTHVMEEACIDKSLLPEMEIKARPLTKNEAFGLRYGTATFDKLEKVGSKEEIGIKKFNVPKI